MHARLRRREKGGKDVICMMVAEDNIGCPLLQIWPKWDKLFFVLSVYVLLSYCTTQYIIFLDVAPICVYGVPRPG